MHIIIITQLAMQHQLFLSKAVEYFGPHISGMYLQGIETPEPRVSVYRKIRKKISSVRNKISPGENFDAYLLDLYNNPDVQFWKTSNAPKRIVADMNSREVQQAIYALKPDVVLIYGGTNMRVPWVDSQRYWSIAMHEGILPRYADDHAMEWAVYREDFEHIGVTIFTIGNGGKFESIFSTYHLSPLTGALQEVRARVCQVGIDAFLETVRKILHGETFITQKDEEQEDGENQKKQFPPPTYHPTIGKMAALKLKLFHQYRFPSVTRALDDIRKHTFHSFIPVKRYQRLENGVYIFLYHSIVDPNHSEEWERCYQKVLTYKHDFYEHVRYLSEHATYIKLSDVPNLLSIGTPPKPYFTITFDDGYTNILKNALDICQDNDIYPTVFVSSAFASQQHVYYRVLLSLLIHRGYYKAVTEEIAKSFNVNVHNETDCFNFCKNYYSYGKIEELIENVWERHFRDEKIICHLDWRQLQFLSDNGWEIGNHTVSHPMLSKLSYAQQQLEIEKNYHDIQQYDLPCMQWLSYPNGNPHDINADTLTWMRNHPDWYGIVIGNGYNRFYSKHEYLRIAVGNDSLPQLRNKIAMANYYSRALQKFA